MNVTPVSPVVDNCNGPDGNSTASNYDIWEKVLICTLAIGLSLATVIGNSMVMISFKIDKQLQTISNHFLFSLAVADFAIGLISMPLFTVYTVLGYWPLGAHVCDTWLALDYLASNASVLNLLIISFDRYFSVTRPLTYRAKRSPNKAGIMIACAWGISVLLWPPWIYAWPYIEGERTVPDDQCYIQFIETNHYITFGTAIAAFYVPVTVMCFLYWRIWRETEKRKKDFTNLQATKQDASKRSNSRYSGFIGVLRRDGMGFSVGREPGDYLMKFSRYCRSDEALDLEGPRRGRSESSTAADEVNSTHLAVSYIDKHYPDHRNKNRPFSWSSLKMWCIAWCIAWWHSGREDDDDNDDDDDVGGLEGSSRTAPCYDETLTPQSVETPFASTVSRGGSWAGEVQSTGDHQDHSRSQTSGDLAIKNIPTDSVYTIVIRLPPSDPPSITMYHQDVMTFQVPGQRSVAIEDKSTDVEKIPPRGTSITPSRSTADRRPSEMPDVRIPLNAMAIQPKIPQTAVKGVPIKSQQPAKKKKRTQEKKAAKTLSAILAAFVITWTPYNILVLLKPLTKACVVTIPQELWSFFYYLCYINSTVNPVCYALCNATFRRTYVRILKCKWHSRNRGGNRGYCPP